MNRRCGVGIGVGVGVGVGVGIVASICHGRRVPYVLKEDFWGVRCSQKLNFFPTLTMAASTWNCRNSWTTWSHQTNRIPTDRSGSGLFKYIHTCKSIKNEIKRVTHTHEPTWSRFLLYKSSIWFHSTLQSTTVVDVRGVKEAVYLRTIHIGHSTHWI
jgi:hypothetical protein